MFIYMYTFLFYRIFNLNIMSYHLLLTCSKISYNLCQFRNLPFCRCPICFPLVEWQLKTTPKHWKYKIFPYILYPYLPVVSFFSMQKALGPRIPNCVLRYPWALQSTHMGPVGYFTFLRGTQWHLLGMTWTTTIKLLGLCFLLA